MLVVTFGQTKIGGSLTATASIVTSSYNAITMDYRGGGGCRAAPENNKGEIHGATPESCDRNGGIRQLSPPIHVVFFKAADNANLSMTHWHMHAAANVVAAKKVSKQKKGLLA